MHRGSAAFLAGAVVTLACLLAPVPCPAQDAAALAAKGRALLEKGDYPGAKAAFLAAVEKDPKAPEARRGAAEALLGLGDSDQALKQAYEGLDLLGNRDAGLWLLAARCFLQKGETLPADRADEIASALADARAKADLAIRNDPSLNAARAVLARACRLSGDLERAGKVLAEGLEKEPRSFDLLFEKGMANLKAGLYPTALESFGKAAEADPSSAEARYQMGITHAWLRQNEDACTCFLKAALLDPLSGRFLSSLGKYAGDDAGRVRWFRDLLKQKPDHAWGHAYFAFYLASAKTRDDAAAVEASKKAMSLRKDDANLVAWHGQVLDLLGKDEEARAWYRRAMERDATLVVAYEKLSQWALDPRSGASMKERRDLIPFLAKRKSGDPFFWNNVGFLYRETKDYKDSLENYLRAAALAPDDQAIQNDTGLIYLYHGRSCGEDPRKSLPFFLRTLALVDEDGQEPTIGYRDSLQNLARYYHEVEPDPEKVLEYAGRRNDPDFYNSLKPPLNVFCREAADDARWAEQQLKKK